MTSQLRTRIHISNDNNKKWSRVYSVFRIVLNTLKDREDKRGIQVRNTDIIWIKPTPIMIRYLLDTDGDALEARGIVNDTAIESAVFHEPNPLIPAHIQQNRNGHEEAPKI